MQLARARRIARRAVTLLELGLELEHIGQVVGAGEPERRVLRGRQVHVVDGLAERERQLLCHLRAGQVLAGDSDGLADQLLAA